MSLAEPRPREAKAGALSLSGVTKRFGGFTALSEVSIRFRPGEIHCLLGENGAGKSTLCNLIFGLYAPDEGEIALGGGAYRPSGPGDALGAGVAMVHQHFSLIDDMSVVDNLLLGGNVGRARRAEYAAGLARLAGHYGLALEPFARVGSLSVGERQRVEIVKALMREPSILILDEPTAVLLPDEIKSLLKVVRQVADEGRTVILVTHKLAEIRHVADRVTVLRQGRVAATSDSPAADLDRLVRAMIQRPLDDLDPAMMVTLGIAPGGSDDKAPGGGVRPAKPRPSGPDALQLDGVSALGADGAVRLDKVTLTLRSGEIVGVAGVEGNGQTELGLILAGLLRPVAGQVVVGGQDMTGRSPAEFTAAGMGVAPEDRHRVGCVTAMSLTDNLYLDRTRVPVRFGLMRRGVMRETAEAMMKRFDIRAAGPDVAFASLSGGNQQKAVLARELTAPRLKVLLAAQPTRGLDVGAVEAVYALIREACARGVAVLLISSELDEILTVADRVVVLYRGRIVGERPASPEQRESIGALMAGGVA